MPSSVAWIKTIRTPKAQRSPSGNGKPPPINCCGLQYRWISKEPGLHEFRLDFSLELPSLLVFKRKNGFWPHVAVHALEGGMGGSSLAAPWGWSRSPLIAVGCPWFPRGWWLCGRSRWVSSCLYCDPFHPSNLHPASPSLREKPASLLHVPLGNSHRCSQGSRQPELLSGLQGFTQPLSPATSGLSQKAERPSGATRQWLAGLKAFQLPSVSRKGCAVGKKGH